jgi:hypothetical protein
MVMSPPQPSPPSSSLAQQIDREILELRNFFEDHREEMMSMLYDPQAQVRILYCMAFRELQKTRFHSLQCFCSEGYKEIYRLLLLINSALV